MNEKMQKLIEILQHFVERQNAANIDPDYFGEVLMSTKEALKVADILEQSTYPPIVRAVLSLLESSGLNDYWWAGVSKNGVLEVYEKEPYYRNLEADWWRDGIFGNFDRLAIFETMVMQEVPAKNLLFQRTESGWIWICKPE